MARINTSGHTSQENTGFGSISGQHVGRYYDKNGEPNVTKIGLSWLEDVSWFHTLIKMKSWKFIALIFAAFVTINLCFSFIYMLIGIEHLRGIEYGSPIHNLAEVFYFSTQTFTTVGYGRISPTGMLVSGVATFEAFIGLLSFALATGLFYARFSQPSSFIKFTQAALLSPFKEGHAIMFRIASPKNNLLTDVEVKLILAIREYDGVKVSNRFYPIDTQISQINTLALSWTIVHPLDEKSPLYGFTSKDIAETPFEILVFIKGYDAVYTNNVIERNSYLNSEIIPNAKFKPMYHPSEDGQSTIMDFSLFEVYDMVEGIPA
jgi:inward rectifier potassium channel